MIVYIYHDDPIQYRHRRHPHRRHHHLHQYHHNTDPPTFHFIPIGNASYWGAIRKPERDGAVFINGKSEKQKGR